MKNTYSTFAVLIVGIQIFLSLGIFFVTQEHTVRILAMALLLTIPFIVAIAGFVIKKMESDKLSQYELSRRITNANWELARSNEQLRIVNDRKSEFIAIASHQLRTPLTAMTGYISMILEDAYGNVPIALRTPLTRALLSARRLTNLVNELLEIARLEQGDIVYDIVSLDAKEVSETVLNEFSGIASEKKITISLDVAESPDPYFILADESKLHEVLHNLVDNALRYTPEGSVKIKVFKSEKGTAVIAVEDTGIGIAPEDIRMLFAKFQRGDRAGKQFADGSGLGLYIVKKLISGMHGAIHVDSEGPGQGATFSVELPLANATQPTLPPMHSV